MQRSKQIKGGKMCKFFSVISDGKGEVLFFRIEDVVKIMSEGNPKSYDFNSHTSIAHFHGIEAKDKSKWNFWEYDIDKKELKEDVIVTTRDTETVRVKIEKYFKGKNIGYMRNLYNRNSGDRNSG
jgi:hypothetical protein